MNWRSRLLRVFYSFCMRRSNGQLGWSCLANIGRSKSWKKLYLKLLWLIIYLLYWLIIFFHSLCLFWATTRACAGPINHSFVWSSNYANHALAGDSTLPDPLRLGFGGKDHPWRNAPQGHRRAIGAHVSSRRFCSFPPCSAIPGSARSCQRYPSIRRKKVFAVFLTFIVHISNL